MAKPGKVRKRLENPQRRHWSLLVYIAGDNNLSDAGLEDIREMCEVGSSDEMYVGVEIDTYGDFSGSIRYEITKPDWQGRAYRMVVERLPEKNSGDPKSLESFVGWGLKRFRATNRLLVVGGHGTGFYTPRRNIAFDDFGSSLDMPEIEAALYNAGISHNNRLQIVGFDACLMNMVEIVHHLAPQVEIVVGSQQTEPGAGWPYDKVLGHAKRIRTATTLAKWIVTEYIADYQRKGKLNITLSAVRTADTDNIIAALDSLGRSILAHFDECRSALHDIRVKTQAFDMADYVDLIHLAALIRERIDQETIKRAASAVETAALHAIIKNGNSGATVANANGLSAWFPPSPLIYYNNRGKYMKLRCNSTNQFGWTSFLDRYHQ
jgi:hypothetical protein